MSWWTRARDGYIGETEALWFGASNKQKAIVIALVALAVLAGRVSKLFF